MKRALLVFLLSLTLGALGLWLVYRDTLLKPESYRLEHAYPPLLLVAGLAFLLHLLAPAIKLMLLCRYQGLPMRLRKAFLIQLVTVFGAVVTPGNSGSAPAMVMALSRLGYPVGKGVGIAAQNVLLDLIFFAWAGPLGLAYLIYSRTLQLPVNAELFTGLAFVMAVGLAVLLSRYPRHVSGSLFWLSRRRFLTRFSARLEAVGRDYYRSAKAYLRFSSGNYLALQLFTALGWFGSFIMLWALLALYSVERHVLVVTALLTDISLIANFVPTPGGSGFIEAAVGLVTSDTAATAPVVLWRLFNYYLFFLLGPLAGWLLYRSRPLLLLRRGRGADRKGGGKARP